MPAQPARPGRRGDRGGRNLSELKSNPPPAHFLRLSFAAKKLSAQ